MQFAPGVSATARGTIPVCPVLTWGSYPRAEWLHCYCDDDTRSRLSLLLDRPVTMGLFAASHALTSQSSTGIMVLFAIVMLLTYVGVAYERFHKTVAALLGAGVLTLLAVFLGVYEYEQIYEFLQHDLNVFGVIIGTGILVDVTGKSGLFHFLSMLIVRGTGGRAASLYLAVCLLTFAFVAVLTIVPAMLILSSLVLVICRSLNYDVKPFLLSAAIGANSGAIVTFASGLPNIMIGTSAGIPYAHFLMVSAPYAVVSLLIAIVVMRFVFRDAIPWKQSPAEQAALTAKIAEFDPWALVESRWILLRSALILGGTVLGFACLSSWDWGWTSSPWGAGRRPCCLPDAASKMPSPKSTGQSFCSSWDCF